MKKKKIILGALLATFSAALLASCGNKEDDVVDTSNTTTDKTSTSEKTSTSTSISTSTIDGNWELITIDELKTLYQNKETPSYNYFEVSALTHGQLHTTYFMIVDGVSLYSNEPIYNSNKTVNVYYAPNDYFQKYFTDYMKEENIYNIKDNGHYEYKESNFIENRQYYSVASDLFIEKNSDNLIRITKTYDEIDSDLSMVISYFDEYLSIIEYYSYAFDEDDNSYFNINYDTIDLSLIDYVIVED